MSRRAALVFIDAEQTTYGVRRLCRVMHLSLRRSTTGPSVGADLPAGTWRRRIGSTPPATPGSSTGGLRGSAAHCGGPRPRPRLEPQARGPADAAGRDGTRAPAPAGQVRTAKRLHGHRPGRGHAAVLRRGTEPVWIADITYLRTWEGISLPRRGGGCLLSSRRGLAMADHLRTELVLDAVGMAVFFRARARADPSHRPVESGQNTAYEFGKALRTSGLLASMGRVGSAFDAMAESVFATLKTELVYPRSWPSPPRAGDGGLLLPRGLLQHPPAPLTAGQPPPRRLREDASDTKRGVRLTVGTS